MPVLAKSNVGAESGHKALSGKRRSAPWLVCCKRAYCFATKHQLLRAQEHHNLKISTWSEISYLDSGYLVSSGLFCTRGLPLQARGQ